MTNLLPKPLYLPHAGAVACIQSRPIDPGRETLLLLAPVGTQNAYMTNPASFFTSRFNVIVLESDALLSFASGTNLPSSAAIADFFRQVHLALPKGIDVDALVGYCSSAPLALLAAAQGACRTLLLLNGAYFLTANNIEKSQYERDVERMMQSIPLGNWAQVYESVSLLHANSPYATDDYRYQQVRPLRERQAFHQYLTFLNQLASLDIAVAARAVEAPTLVWCGGDDRHTACASSKYVAQRLAQAELVEDPVGQHHDFVDGHAPLYQAMSAFVARHAARATL